MLVCHKAKSYAPAATSWQTRYGKVTGSWGQAFEPKGQSNIAGLACTEYYVRPKLELDNAHVCMTSDGVVLRRYHLDGSLSEVVSVSYESVSRSRVTVPPDYEYQNRGPVREVPDY